MIRRFFFPLLVLSVVVAGSSATGAPSALRIAVASPDLPVGSAGDEVRPAAELFEAELTSHLLQLTAFEVVERSGVGVLLDELARSMAQPDPDAAPPRIGALAELDWAWVWRVEGSATSMHIAWRVVGTAEMGIDELDGEIDAEGADAILTAAAQTARRLANHATRRLVRRDARSLVSLAGVVLESPVEAQDWLPGTIERSIRGALRTTPGVLMLERQRLEELYMEFRLRRGGLTQDRPAEPVAVERYVVLTGRLTHRQPPGQSLEVWLTLEGLDNSTGAVMTREVRTGADDVAGLKAGAAAAALALVETDTSVDAAPPDVAARRTEARRMGIRVWELAALNGSINAEKDFDRYASKESAFWGWTTDSWFLPHGGDMFRTPQRQAVARQALAYARAAVMLDDGDPALKSLLAILLVDADIARIDEVVDLAQEIMASYPRTVHDHRAMTLLIHLDGVPKDRLLDIVERYLQRNTTAKDEVEGIAAKISTFRGEVAERARRIAGQYASEAGLLRMRLRDLQVPAPDRVEDVASARVEAETLLRGSRRCPRASIRRTSGFGSTSRRRMRSGTLAPGGVGSFGLNRTRSKAFDALMGGSPRFLTARLP